MSLGKLLSLFLNHCFCLNLWAIFRSRLDFNPHCLLETQVTSQASYMCLLTDTRSYYQTIMYEKLGINGKTNLLVAGIYNCTGPIASKFGILFSFIKFSVQRLILLRSVFYHIYL